jgi:hypothetical protein
LSCFNIAGDVTGGGATNLLLLAKTLLIHAIRSAGRDSGMLPESAQAGEASAAKSAVARRAEIERLKGYLP